MAKTSLEARIALRGLPPFGFGLRVDLLGVEIEVVDAGSSRKCIGRSRCAKNPSAFRVQK
jgi:hypothetical protein